MLKNLNFGYTKKYKILHNINFSVESGQLVSLIGPNGSGKTTIIKCINQDTVALSQVKYFWMELTFIPCAQMELAKSRLCSSNDKNFMGGTVLDAVLMGRRPYIKWKNYRL